MSETVEIPQLPFDEKIVVVPGIQTVHGPQTSESLNGEFDAGHEEKSEQDALAVGVVSEAKQRQPHSSKHMNQQQSTPTSNARENVKKKGRRKREGKKW